MYCTQIVYGKQWTVQSQAKVWGFIGVTMCATLVILVVCSKNLLIRYRTFSMDFAGGRWGRTISTNMLCNFCASSKGLAFLVPVLNSLNLCRVATIILLELQSVEIKSAPEILRFRSSGILRSMN